MPTEWTKETRDPKAVEALANLHHAVEVQKRLQPPSVPALPPLEGIAVAHPRCWTAPYGPVGAVEIPISHPGFTQDDSRLPPQPNNQAVISDGSSGVCGHSTLWSHDAGLLDSSNASLEMDRTAMVGAWMQVGRVVPTIWANFTGQGDEIVSDGNVHFFGSGGSADLSAHVQLDVFDAGQPLGSPPWSTANTTTRLSTSNLDTRIVQSLQPGASAQVSGSPGSLHLSQGEWILVMAAVVARHVVSLNGTSLVVSSVTTWQVTSICAWL